jgi:hypothetical protein
MATSPTARSRLLLPALVGSASLLLMGLGMPRTVEPVSAVEPAKLGFSYLTREQYKDLWRRADNYAMAEAFLTQCGAPSHVERRMRHAARDCIEARALDRVAAYFRRKMAEFTAKHKFVCDTEQSKALIRSTRAKIDSDVAEVRSMCRSCMFC